MPFRAAASCDMIRHREGRTMPGSGMANGMWRRRGKDAMAVTANLPAGIFPAEICPVDICPVDI
jgi:hypothetical protein